jgi:hypothetical protein
MPWIRVSVIYHCYHLSIISLEWVQMAANFVH